MPTDVTNLYVSKGNTVYIDNGTGRYMYPAETIGFDHIVGYPGAAVPGTQLVEGEEYNITCMVDGSPRNFYSIECTCAGPSPAFQQSNANYLVPRLFHNNLGVR